MNKNELFQFIQIQNMKKMKLKMNIKMPMRAWIRLFQAKDSNYLKI